MTIKRSVESPWRRLFEEVRALIGNRRDDQGMLGSINWLRKQMAQRGANPNVVRNIIYRDKGKLEDKRALYDILKTLHSQYSDTPLRAPELEALLTATSTAEQEIAQLLGREKRRAYSRFVSGLRGGEAPKLLITGKPGSGKTLLLDYIQQALELPPRAAERLLRVEFSSQDLFSALTSLAQLLELSPDLMEAKLVKLGRSSAFSVQADSQADIARLLESALRQDARRTVLILHLSQSLSEQHMLASTPLRLNTPDVPRVNAAEWLWHTLLEPLSHVPQLSLLVSMAHLPARVGQQLGAFEGPVKLNPPTVAEARRFVKARLPQLTAQQQEAVVQRAGRSFEELRTLTLLAEIREPLPQEEQEGSEHVKALSQLVETAGDLRLRDFLRALATVAVPDYPTFSQQVLLAVRDPANRTLSSLEQAFLDVVPGQQGVYRCFSRQLARSLRQRFSERQLEAYRALNARAAACYQAAAEARPAGDQAGRYLHHLLEARDWTSLTAWLERWSVPQTLLRRLWEAAQSELPAGPALEAIALRVAAHYVRLGSYRHPDVEAAFALLERWGAPRVRLWTTLKRAEGAVLRGRVAQAEALLRGWEEHEDPALRLEHALLRASIARWHGDLERAAYFVSEEARPLLAAVAGDAAEGRLAHAKVAVWSGLIHKDRGKLEQAERDFASVPPGDELIEARVAFQLGDVQLQLGRFDAALASLSEAVQRAYRSEAPVQEQARYLSRRASLHRLRGELEQAEADFAAASSLLQDEGEEDRAERAFWRAKVEDERALYLLARGEVETALFSLTNNLMVFGAYQAATQIDAGYRLLRTRLKLALAYGLRALGQPYCLPLLPGLAASAEHPDRRHATTLLGDVLGQLEAQVEAKPSYQSLWREALQVASLLEPSAERRILLARQALELSAYSQQQALSACYLAAAHLQAGEAEQALAASRQATQALQELRGPSEQGDRACFAWQTSLTLRALLLQRDLEAACGLLEHSLDSADLALYRRPLLRAFGEALEAYYDDSVRRAAALARLLGDGPLSSDLRLPDALTRHATLLRRGADEDVPVLA